jgi:ABC-2 type transport system ATP-binding protein
MQEESKVETAMPMLQADGLCQEFSGNRVLDGLTFTVLAGQALCLLGHNGVGKTTALNHFLGFLKPLSGTVRVAGLDPVKDSGKCRQLIGYVPENAALYPHLNAFENIDYFLAAGGNVKPDEGALVASLENVGFPIASARAAAAGYSKGMRQKVVLALALMKKAKVLLLDEPTTGLDPHSAEELARQVLRLKSQGVAVLAVTHDLVWARQIADHLGIMHGGKLQEIITSSELEPHELADRIFSGGASRAELMRGNGP